MAKVTYQDVKNREEINIYIEKGNEVLGEMGYTDHSQIHAIKVAETAGTILRELGYKKRQIELAKIAGYLHDIGNCINRKDHAHSGALMAFWILQQMEMKPEEIAQVASAIGQHDESTGMAVDAVSAAVILADKTDVRRNRVRNPVRERFDKHDQVNYAAISSELIIEPENKTIKLRIELDENICSMMDYFEIFLQRMLMCKKAAEILKMNFKLTANGNKIC